MRRIAGWSTGGLLKKEIGNSEKPLKDLNTQGTLDLLQIQHSMRIDIHWISNGYPVCKSNILPPFVVDQ